MLSFAKLPVTDNFIPNSCQWETAAQWLPKCFTKDGCGRLHNTLYVHVHAYIISIMIPRKRWREMGKEGGGRRVGEREGNHY